MRNQFEQKMLHFAVALNDVYKDEDEKESLEMTPLELKEESLTEDFTAMVYAMWVMYVKVTGDDIDIIGFTHIVNRLVVQQLMKDKCVN